MPTAQRVYAMLDNESLWDAAQRCHEALAAAKIPHAIVGGVAVCLHGYQRNTVDVDLLVRKEDTAAIRQTLSDAGFRWNAKEVEFRSLAGVAVQFVLSGEKAGKGSEVQLPDPAEPRIVKYLAGLPVLSLARLIESKIACAEGNVRRTYKDLADVVELIAVNKLNAGFARYLHKTLRATFRELVRRARAE
jgi:hypothetical protein